MPHLNLVNTKNDAIITKIGSNSFSNTERERTREGERERENALEAEREKVNKLYKLRGVIANFVCLRVCVSIRFIINVNHLTAFKCNSDGYF